MKQQINLFIKKEKVKTKLSAGQCSAAVLGLALLMALLSLWQTSGLSAMRAEVAELKRQTKELTAQAQQLRQQKQPKSESVKLRQQYDQLQQKLTTQQQYAELLAQLAPPGSGVFSPLLQGLSEQALEGVWLSRIQAQQQGAALILQGSASKAELLPRYLKQLGQAEAYQRTLFDQFELSRSERELTFRVSGSRPLPEGS
jgi:Tfp pilus assembly protein PilN